MGVNKDMTLRKQAIFCFCVKTILCDKLGSYSEGLLDFSYYSRNDFETSLEKTIVPDISKFVAKIYLDEQKKKEVRETLLKEIRSLFPKFKKMVYGLFITLPGLIKLLII